jgi:hypothetical protein
VGCCNIELALFSSIVQFEHWLSSFVFATLGMDIIMFG